MLAEESHCIIQLKYMFIHVTKKENVPLIIYIQAHKNTENYNILYVSSGLILFKGP